jgi:hypothetical protein
MEVLQVVHFGFEPELEHPSLDPHFDHELLSIAQLDAADSIHERC